MVTSRQIKEKIRDYRRSIKHSWQLFRESRIGLMGLGIMVMFIIIALVSPYLGLRHPTNWWAPDEDILEIEPFWGEDGVGTNGPFLNGMTYRMTPAGGVTTVCDRLYAAGGSGSVASPYGLYAYEPQYTTRQWTFTTSDSPITTRVTAINFGSEDNPVGADLRIFFGCEDGTLYVLRDGYVESWSDFAPSGDNVWSYQLDGQVVGKVATYNFRGNGFNSNDKFFASTTAGTLYAFGGDDYLWEINLSNVSLTAPAVSESGDYVYVGTVDGELYGIDVASGLEIPDWGGSSYHVTDGYWSTAPVAIGTPPVVYAATDDGIIHSIWGSNGTAKSGWDHLDGSNLRDGFQIRNTELPDGVDGGNLTDIGFTPDGGYLIVGSDTGYVYSINAGSVNTSISFNTKIGTQDTEVTIMPYYDWRFSKYLYITATNLNDTAADPSDDFSLLYCIASPGNASVIWRKTMDGLMVAPPISYLVNFHVSKADVVISTVQYNEDGEVVAGRMYSYNAAGRVIMPLPPTWAVSDENKPPSGNYYWLGTDDRGHDILSQTLLGSRIALLVGFLSAACSIGIGIIVGLVSGYYGGGIDALLMRFTDVILVLPGLPLLITFAAIMSPSIWNIIIIISVVGWGGVARVIRSEVLSLKERPFIDAARVTGASKSRIMFRHIAPNVLPLAMLYMTFAVSGAILYEASLSFIGLGDPSTMTWGMMLNYVQHSNALTNWWWLLPPGLCITLVCLAFFLLGRAFDEIVNPRLRRRR